MIHAIPIQMGQNYPSFQLLDWEQDYVSQLKLKSYQWAPFFQGTALRYHVALLFTVITN